MQTLSVFIVAAVSDKKNGMYCNAGADQSNGVSVRGEHASDSERSRYDEM